MNLSRIKLSKQLLLLVGIAFALLFTSLGFVLPKVLIPVAEENLYNYLKEPLIFVDDETDKKILNKEIAYIYEVRDRGIVVSDNLEEVTGYNDPKLLIKEINDIYGKFEVNHKTYYYYTIESGQLTKIAITNDNYINRTKAAILGTVFPIVLITFLIIGFILVLWSLMIVWKIEKLKDKIDNIDNIDYDHSVNFEADDEMRSLALAIEDMRISLINQEKYRNKMYQNISHDFKTPLTVIKSYVEAVEDDVEDEKTALQVIKQQTIKLEQKVHSLLYLNKLDYLKDSKIINNVVVDMESIINTEVEKFKFHRKELEFIVEFDKKSKFYGTNEHWETILDNLLSNFMRYANTTIKITAKQNKLILYNDGDNIDNNLLEGIFTPFRKGIKGEFGLGLSIVKKTLNIMNYDIEIKNEKKGVSFIIKGNHK